MAEYIERDEAVRKAISACIKIVGHGITQIDAADIADEIDTIPAADVVEVRHGEWRKEIRPKKSKDGLFYWNAQPRVVYVCSVCGRDEPKKEPYCNCGAKMDGGKDDG